MEIDQIRLGRTYYDTVTGFEGTATAKAEYLYNSDQVYLEGAVNDNGESPSLWVEVERVEGASS